MSQMYRVKFARQLADGMVDMGDCLIVAQNQDAACDAVRIILEIDKNTEFDVSRVKPSFYQIARREVKKSLSTFDANAVDQKFASSATFPTETWPDEFWHAVEAKANIRAENENEAILKLAKSLVREMAGERQKMSCKELDILCDRTEYHPRAPAVEQNALYSVHSFFRGGAGRPK